MVRLFIEGREIELTDDVQFAITKQFEDLSNPTAIINDWSKTVSIPFSTKNNATFGHIYNPDRTIVETLSSNILTDNAPSSIKKWNGTGTGPSDYVVDSLVNGEIVCPYNTEYLQCGFQKQDWQYSNTINYSCSEDSHSYDFIYDPIDDYRFEFSFRNPNSAANSGELYFVQWALGSCGLVAGKKYTISFKHRRENSNYIIYDFAMREAQPIIGINFNPLQKLDFRLEWDSTILMTGYAKMNDIKQSNGVGTYQITLFGQLGKIFQDLKKITFDTSSPDSNHIIDGSQYVKETINKDLVYYSWCHSNQSNDVLYKKGDSGYSIHDIIGFAPNNSFSEGFDYQTFQWYDNDSHSMVGKPFTEVLGDAFTEDTGITPDTAIPNGMLPREIGEYRSYYQLPFIYWNKLFRIFQAKSETLTGYKFDMDETWFNEINPYWFNLVYMLRPLNNIKNTTYNNLYNSNNRSALVAYTNSSAKYKYTFGYYEPGLTFNIQSEQIPLIKQTGSYDHYFQFTDAQIVDGHLSVIIKMDVDTNLGSSQDIHIRNNAVFVIDVYMTDEAVGHSETERVQLGRICVKWSDSSYVAGNTTYTVNVPTKSIPANGYTWTLVDRDFSFEIPANKYNKEMKFCYSINGWHAETSFSGTLFVNTNPSSVGLGDIHVYATPNSLQFGITPLIGKSFSTFTLNDLWNNEYNLFTEVLKYCKMYRISISVDEFEKKIIFKPTSKYFQNYEILDWTDKIDMSKDFTITPITLENKYVLLNYDDNKTKLGGEYKENYGVNYGDYRLITDYNFNSETKKLFEKIKTSIVNTDNILSWINLYNNHNIVYSFPSEISVYNKDKDNKQVDIFGAFYFHNGVTAFDSQTSLNLRTPHISDDTTFQQVNNTYFYTQNADTTIEVSTYPLLDIVRDNNCCLFNIPSKNYTFRNNYSNKNSIYNNFWENYVDERYNIQNKKITCYVDIKPYEYQNFDWNKLVKVNNQLCMVNKIYDYDVTSAVPTKVDLITIQDIDGYNSDNYQYNYLVVNPNQVKIPYDHYKVLEVKSSGPWYISGGDWQDVLDIYPREGNAGVSEILVGSTDQKLGASFNVELYNEQETEIIGISNVSCSVGGTSTITAASWFNEVAIGGSTTVTITAPSVSWSVYKIDKHGNDSRKVSTYPSIGTGTTTLTVSVPSDSATGIVDVYLKDLHSNNATSYRVNIVAAQ